MKIVANKTEITKIGNRIISLASEYQDRMKQISGVAEKIQLCWSGNDANAFIETLSQYIIAIEQLNSLIEKYGTYLNKVVESYSSIDKY